jgi:hypothetical protein
MISMGASVIDSAVGIVATRMMELSTYEKMHDEIGNCQKSRERIH